MVVHDLAMSTMQGQRRLRAETSPDAWTSIGHFASGPRGCRAFSKVGVFRAVQATLVTKCAPQQMKSRWSLFVLVVCAAALFFIGSAPYWCC